MQTIRIKAGEKFRFIVEDESGEIFNKIIDTSQITYHVPNEDVKVVDMPAIPADDKKLFSETLGQPTDNEVVDMPTTLTGEVRLQQAKDRGDE